MAPARSRPKSPPCRWRRRPASLESGDRQLSVTWHAADGATTYTVYRSTSTTSTSFVAIAAHVSALSFVDSGLANGTRYYYRLRAFAPAGTSDLSSIMSAVPVESAPATAPGSLTATPGNTRVALAWSAVPGATSYRVYRSTTGEFDRTVLATVTTTTFTNFGCSAPPAPCPSARAAFQCRDTPHAVVVSVAVRGRRSRRPDRAAAPARAGGPFTTRKDGAMSATRLPSTIRSKATARGRGHAGGGGPGSRSVRSEMPLWYAPPRNVHATEDRMRRLFWALVIPVCLLSLAGPAAPASAQAKGSAEAGAAKRSDPDWKVPRTPWGHPDLEGTWTTDDMRGVPMSRPAQFGTRVHLTDAEFAARAKQRATARDIDDARTGTFRNEEGSRDFGYTSLVIDPPDGRVPALTPEAAKRPRRAGTFGTGPWEKVQDFSLYDRCITRGMIGSFMPAVYGNGARIIQTPDAVVITYEMIHDTRVIPLDGRPHVGPAFELMMGDSRGRWEGDTLVVESRRFTDRTAVGGSTHTADAIITERFTRVDPEMIDYEVTVTDPKTFTRPWTMRLTITQQPDYQIYEYACHEGNRAMANTLSAERAYEKAVDEARAKGLPPPERVFERVNGADRAR